MAQPPPTTVIVTPAVVSSTYPDLNTSACWGLGVTQLVIGILVLVLEVIIRVLFISSSQGFWAGIFVIIAGTLGMGAAKTLSKGLTIACGVLSIIAAVLAFIAMIVAFLLATTGALLGVVVYLILEAISGVLFLAEFGIGIAHCVICFRPACCPTNIATATATTTTVMTYPAMQMAPGQYPAQPDQPGYGYPAQPNQPGYGYPAQPGQPGYGYPAQPGQPGYVQADGSQPPAYIQK